MVLRCELIAKLFPDEDAFADACAALPEWRKRKCDNFRFEADRRRSVAAWELLRRMLAERGVCAEKLEVSENAFGKPAFKPALGIHFSLSHAGERVMAAVHDGPVGCDVERVGPFDGAVARECLTRAEQESIECLTGLEKDRAFARLWVRKEAYAKAVGRGFGVEPKLFAALPGAFPPGWSVDDLDFGDGYLGCVVCRGRCP